MSEFSLSSGIFGSSRSVLETQDSLERAAETRSKTTKHNSCKHCNRLRSNVGGVFGMVNGYSSEEKIEVHSNGQQEEEEWEKVDATDLETIKNERPTLLATMSDCSVESHESDSPILRRNNIPDKYMDRFMSLSLYSGKELAEEVNEIIERLKECDMTGEEIEKYLAGRELDIKNGQTSDVYITCDGERYKTGLQIYTRASQTLKGLRHFIKGIENTQLAKDLALEENDILLMIDSDCVTEWPHKRVVNCLSDALKNLEDIALVIFRDLPGRNNNIYLTVRGQVNILIPRGHEPIEVIAVNSLSQELVDNRVIGLRKMLEMPPIFIWQHEMMGTTAQYSMSVKPALSDKYELYMEVTSEVNEKAHWVIHQYRGETVTFENGFRSDDDKESMPHTIWMIRNKCTGRFIAIDDQSKEVTLSQKGILPDHKDAMLIDERMLLAHPQKDLRNTFLFESLRMTAHFLCVDNSDKHRVDISDNTDDSYIHRFAFQVCPVSLVLGKMDELPTITKYDRADLFGNGVTECNPEVCPKNLINGTHEGESFERVDASYLFAENGAEEYSLLRDRRNRTGSKKDGEDYAIPSGPIKNRWNPLALATKNEEPAVWKRAGMHKFLPPQESQAEKEGVAVEGRVRNMKDVYEFNTPSSWASCAVSRGHVEILSKTFKV
ncbi:uncharacterized protein LOC135494475 [Lineus longissimus]|uniref:uncharacterized protein LOC135494475 n=1 Tax=Lineus longissimus TaxID=88925 RepID=UPI002B4C4DB6